MGAAALGLMAAGSVLVGAPAQAATSGVNNSACRAVAGKDPVIMLHGLGAPAGVNWFTKAPLIAANGYCVFTPQIGTRWGVGNGFGAMRDSSRQVAAYVDQVRASTGAARVNLVGHSMGTTIAAYYLKFDGGATQVNNFIGFGANYHGTTLYGLNKLVRALGLGSTVDAVCSSCDEFLPPSQFLDDLADGGISVAGPRYLNIVSRYDEVVVPYTSGTINEPGVTNIVLQNHCRGLTPDLAGHLSQAVDPNVTSLILWGLKGQPRSRPGCVPFLIPG